MMAKWKLDSTESFNVACTTCLNLHSMSPQIWNPWSIPFSFSSLRSFEALTGKDLVVSMKSATSDARVREIIEKTNLLPRDKRNLG